MRQITTRRQEKLANVLARRQPDLTLVLANIHDPHNVSAIYRSADAFGVTGIHLYYTDTEFPHLGRKSSASARKWVETYRHQSKEELAETLHKQKYTILATSCSPVARPMGDYDLTRPTAIIMGNEHSGVPAELADIVDGEIYIPMYGMIQSFNVSVAAALLLYEAARQRALVGMYESSRWSTDEYERRLKEWLDK